MKTLRCFKVEYGDGRTSERKVTMVAAIDVKEVLIKLDNKETLNVYKVIYSVTDVGTILI